MSTTAHKDIEQQHCKVRSLSTENISIVFFFRLELQLGCALICLTFEDYTSREVENNEIRSLPL